MHSCVIFKICELILGLIMIAMLVYLIWMSNRNNGRSL